MKSTMRYLGVKAGLLAVWLAVPAAAADFTDSLWKEIQPVYAKTLEHSFLTGLTDGTLSRSKFQFYLVQDSHYLRAFAQALNVLASKAPKEDWAITLGRHAIEALEVERQLHESILGKYGVSPATVAKSDVAPSNYAYANHMLAAVHRGSFAEGLAALLPCYWIYWEVGKELKKKGSKNPEYQRWIEQYSSDDYGNVVKQVLGIMNAEAVRISPTERRNATRLFILSARYEYMFWDMAWREEKWKP